MSQRLTLLTQAQILRAEKELTVEILMRPRYSAGA
jgi:hypothetical protein